MTYPPPDPGSPQDRPPSDPFSSPPHWGPHDPYSPPPAPGGPAGAGGRNAPSGPGPGHGPSGPGYGSGPGGGPDQGQPSYGQTTPFGQTSPYGPTPPYGPTSPGPTPPGPTPPGPTSPPGPPYGPPGQYGGEGPRPPRRNRGLVIAGTVFAAVLVLCLGGGVGGFLLLRDTDTDGAESPTAAVQAFLQAVYRDLDAGRAAQLVCSQARDESALAAKVAEISAYQDSYLEPRFTWSSPEVVDRDGDLAFIETTVTMMTGDEKTSDLRLRVTVLDKGSNGWWVCDLETVTPEPPVEDGGDGEDEAGEDGAAGGGSGDGEGETQT